MPHAAIVAVLFTAWFSASPGINAATEARAHHSGTRAAQPSGQTRHVRFSLVVPEHPVTAGESITVALRFDIDEGWHMYWNGRNDSGLAPTVNWTLPEGWAVKQTRWPAPVRYTSDILLDHVYHDRVVLLATVSVPADMANPGGHRIKADTRWMVCQEACVIERGSAEASIAVSSPHERPRRDKPLPEHPLIHAAEKAMPRPVSEAGVLGHEITPIKEPPGATEGPRALGFRVTGAVKLEFYPDRDCAELADLLGEGSVASDTISLTLARQPSSDTQGTNMPAPRLKGVLAIWPVGEFSPVYYLIE